MVPGQDSCIRANCGRSIPTDLITSVCLIPPLCNANACDICALNDYLFTCKLILVPLKSIVSLERAKLNTHTLMAKAATAKKLLVKI